MANVLGWAGFGIAAGGSFAVAWGVAKICLNGLFRAMMNNR
jgi:hypothetical protein